MNKKIAGGLVTLGVGAASIGLGVGPAQASMGYFASNQCGNWAGANHAVTMGNYWGGWDLVPCGHTYSNITKIYYGGPGYMKLGLYPNTCFPTGATAYLSNYTNVLTTATCP